MLGRKVGLQPQSSRSLHCDQVLCATEKGWSTPAWRCHALSPLAKDQLLHTLLAMERKRRRNPPAECGSLVTQWSIQFVSSAWCSSRASLLRVLCSSVVVRTSWPSSACSCCLQDPASRVRAVQPGNGCCSSPCIGARQASRLPHRVERPLDLSAGGEGGLRVLRQQAVVTGRKVGHESSAALALVALPHKQGRPQESVRQDVTSAVPCVSTVPSCFRRCLGPHVTHDTRHPRLTCLSILFNDLGKRRNCQVGAAQRRFNLALLLARRWNAGACHRPHCLLRLRARPGRQGGHSQVLLHS